MHAGGPTRWLMKARPCGDTSREAVDQGIRRRAAVTRRAGIRSRSRPALGGLVSRPRPSAGLRPTVRFALVLTLTLGYVALSVYVSRSWRADLETAIGPVMSWVIPIALAYIPGLLVGFLSFTLIATHYRPPDLISSTGASPSGAWPAVTVLVAARNEEASIGETLERLADLSYPGPLEIVLADNDSTDETAGRAGAVALRTGLRFRRVLERTPGKHRALNAALATVTTPLVVTVDADTLLHPEALTRLVSRITSRPQDQHACACAGALVAGNSRTNFLTRMQGWDYRLGINGVKRMQAAYNSALVAQGAFSAYWTDDIRAVGGWPDAIGEDIVLTWTLMLDRGIVQYEPTALAFTTVPERRSQFMHQRSRWARGMFEGIRSSPPLRQPRVLAKLVAGMDYLVPFLDIGYVFFWIPGVVLFLFGYPIIFSWWSMLVIPLTLLINGLLRRWQERHVLRPLGVLPSRDRLGYLGYLFAYQALSSSAALRGYWQYLAGTARRWE
jgi:poly-beta-1,6-N-acetyl-D-glucosamine synthase